MVVVVAAGFVLVSMVVKFDLGKLLTSIDNQIYCSVLAYWNTLSTVLAAAVSALLYHVEKVCLIIVTSFPFSKHDW